MRARTRPRSPDAGVSASQPFFAELAFLPGGWMRNVRIDVDAAGTIASVAPDTVAGDATRLAGAVLPGIANTHSHAFQYAVAGRLEGVRTDRENFWTWRDGMYELAGRLSPDDVESIASFLYVTMLEAGYTSVGEFHYLHNAPGGAAYETKTEMSDRLLQAARNAGIGITLLLVLYRHGDFGRGPVLPAQRRFVLDVDEVGSMLAALTARANDSRERIGVAPHSLRAVAADELRELLALVEAETPVHIHIAEQQREVEECSRFYGRRPIAWLLENAPVSPAWTLVHATHAQPGELSQVATRGAVVALCPTTEADLGDGIFPAHTYLEAGGAFGIGSDSHVAVDPAEELRVLEYAQRLTQHRRVILAENGSSAGETLYARAARGGAQSLGVPGGAIEAGARADLVTLDLEGPALAGCKAGALLDAWIFGGGRGLVSDVVVAGKRVVSAGVHPHRDAAARRYKQTLRKLFA